MSKEMELAMEKAAYEYCEKIQNGTGSQYWVKFDREYSSYVEKHTTKKVS